MSRIEHRPSISAAMEAVDASADEFAAVGVHLADAARAAPAFEEAIAAEAKRQADDRQRDIDAAFADAVEVVARQRARLKRRVCSRHDGATARMIWELLKAMQEGGADDDPSFRQ